MVLTLSNRGAIRKVVVSSTVIGWSIIVDKERAETDVIVIVRVEVSFYRKLVGIVVLNLAHQTYQSGWIIAPRDVFHEIQNNRTEVSRIYEVVGIRTALGITQLNVPAFGC